MTNTIKEKINNGLLSFDELCDFIVNSDLSFEEKAAIVNYYVIKRLEQLGLDEKILEQIKSKQFEYCHAKSEEKLTSFLENKKNNGIAICDKNTFQSARQGKSFDACYSKQGKVILIGERHLNSKAGIASYIHELLHCLSHNNDKVGFEISGVYSGLNEGFTCKLCSIITEEDIGRGYPAEYIYFCNIIQELCGKSDIEFANLYFDKNSWLTEELRNNFNSQNSEALAIVASMYDKKNPDFFKRHDKILTYIENFHQFSKCEKETIFKQHMLLKNFIEKDDRVLHHTYKKSK